MSKYEIFSRKFLVWWSKNVTLFLIFLKCSSAIFRCQFWGLHKIWTVWGTNRGPIDQKRSDGREKCLVLENSKKYFLLDSISSQHLTGFSWPNSHKKVESLSFLLSPVTSPKLYLGESYDEKQIRQLFVLRLLIDLVWLESYIFVCLSEIRTKTAPMR